MIKGIIKKLLIFSITATMLLMAGCGEKAKEEGAEPKNESEQNSIAEIKNAYHAEIVIKDMGTVKLVLDGDNAPIAAENFVKLAKEGFYDGLTFHRIIKGFMIQGGDPKGDGTGGSSENIKGEFSANGVKNPISHKRGVISMARSSSRYENYLAAGYKLSDLPDEVQAEIENAFNSASSQFFIVHEDAAYLDGDYAAFGYVTEGMEIVDKIATETPVIDDNGTVEEGHKPIIETIKITD